MKEFTQNEKQILLDALDHYIDAHNRPRTKWIEPADGVITIDLSPLRELRAKLILDIAPIEIRVEDMGNKNIAHKWHFHCHLCGEVESTNYPEFPEFPIVDGHRICFECFRKYSPEKFQEVCEGNARYLDDYIDDMVEAENPTDGPWRNDLPF